VQVFHTRTEPYIFAGNAMSAQHAAAHGWPAAIARAKLRKGRALACNAVFGLLMSLFGDTTEQRFGPRTCVFGLLRNLGSHFASPVVICAHCLHVCALELFCGACWRLGAQHSTIFDNMRNIETYQKVSRQSDIIVLENIAEQAHKAQIDRTDSNVRGFDSFVEHAH